MNLTPQQIAERILEKLNVSHRLKLHEVIEVILSEENPQQSESSISDIASSLCEKVRKQLNKKLGIWTEQKIFPLFRWGEIDINILFSNIAPKIVGGLEHSEGKYKLSDSIRKYLMKIEPRSFEKLGKALLKNIGSESFLTRASKDEGIDFGGVIKFNLFNVSSIDYSLFERVFQDLSFRVIGQAKRYRGTVSVKELRELQGTNHVNILNNIVEKHKNDEQVRLLENHSLPIIFLFISTGEFSKDARKYANDVGMLLMDGNQIAQALAHMEIGCTRSSTGLWQFERESIELWLEEGTLEEMEPVI
nr:restriction endonuclease [Paenibacillus xylanexedens]